MSDTVAADVFLRPRLGAYPSARRQRVPLGSTQPVYFDVVDALTGELVPGATEASALYWLAGVDGTDSPATDLDIVEISPGTLRVQAPNDVPGTWLIWAQIEHPSAETARIVYDVPDDGGAPSLVPVDEWRARNASSAAAGAAAGRIGGRETGSEAGAAAGAAAGEDAARPFAEQADRSAQDAATSETIALDAADLAREERIAAAGSAGEADQRARDAEAARIAAEAEAGKTAQDALWANLSRSSAEQAAGIASTAAATASAGANLYPTVAAGLTATAEGATFSVQAAGETYASTYRKVSGAAVFINSLAGKLAIDRERATRSAVVDYADRAWIVGQGWVTGRTALLLNQSRRLYGYTEPGQYPARWNGTTYARPAQTSEVQAEADARAALVRTLPRLFVAGLGYVDWEAATLSANGRVMRYRQAGVSYEMDGGRFAAPLTTETVGTLDRAWLPGWGWVQSVRMSRAGRRALSAVLADNRTLVLSPSGLIVPGQGGTVAADARPAADYLQDYTNRWGVLSDPLILYIIPLYGQSLARGQGGDRTVAADGTITTTGPISTAVLYPGFAFMPAGGVFVDGTRFATMEGLREIGQESSCSSMVNHFIARTEAATGFRPRVATFNASVGGLSFLQLKRGQAAYRSFLRALEDVVSWGKAQGYKPFVPAWVWRQGEQDRADGTAFVTRKRNLAQMARWVDEDCKRITGQWQDVMMITYQPNNALNVPFTYQPIFEAHRLMDGEGLIRCSGPIYHTERMDVTHADAPGYYRMGKQDARAICAELFREGAAALQPTRIWWDSPTRLCVQCHAPTLPLVIDRSGVDVVVPTVTADGFEFTDYSGSPPAITGVALQGSDTVAITLASRPSGARGVLTYAYRVDSSGARQGRRTGPRGTIRDSTQDPSLIDGRADANWLTSFWADVPAAPV